MIHSHLVEMSSTLDLGLSFALLARRSEGGGCGAMGCFIFLMLAGGVIYLVMKGKQDRREQLGASRRPLASGALQPHTFACPFPKCSNCGATGEKMKQQWDGLRKVTWTCSYCGNAQIQELKDEELPLSARQRLGLDPQNNPYEGRQQGLGSGWQQGGGGDAMGGMLTGMMLGSMLGGGHHHHGSSGNEASGDQGGWDNNDDAGSGGDSGSDWGDGGDSGGDWGDGGDGDWS